MAEPDYECRADRTAQPPFGEQGIGYDQQRKDHRHKTRRYMMFSRIHEVEIERKLQKPQQYGPAHHLHVDPDWLAHDYREREHAGRCNHKTIGHRPRTGNGAKLVADNEPGRPPDQRHNQERHQYAWSQQPRLGARLKRSDGFTMRLSRWRAARRRPRYGASSLQAGLRLRPSRKSRILARATQLLPPWSDE